MANWIEELTTKKSTTPTASNWIESYKESTTKEIATKKYTNQVKSYIVDGKSNKDKAAKIIYNAAVSGVDQSTLNSLAEQMDYTLSDLLTYERDQTDVGTVASSTAQGALDAIKGVITSTTGYTNPIWKTQSYAEYQNQLNREDMVIS